MSFVSFELNVGQLKALCEYFSKLHQMDRVSLAYCGDSLYAASREIPPCRINAEDDVFDTYTAEKLTSKEGRPASEILFHTAGCVKCGRGYGFGHEQICPDWTTDRLFW